MEKKNINEEIEEMRYRLDTFEQIFELKKRIDDLFELKKRIDDLEEKISKKSTTYPWCPSPITWYKYDTNTGGAVTTSGSTLVYGT